jgi:hypothetical protein
MITLQDKATHLRTMFQGGFQTCKWIVNQWKQLPGLSVSIVSLLLLVLFIPQAASAVNEGSVSPGTKEDARQLLEKFMQPGADLKALLNELRPSPEDCAAVFVGEAIQHAQENYETVPWDDDDFVKQFTPKEGQTELLVFSATTEDFKFMGFNNPNKEAEIFPKGYMRYADRFKSGVTWYCWGFVKPGEEIDWPAQALTHVNGRWVLFLQAHRASGEIPK